MYSILLLTPPLSTGTGDRRELGLGRDRRKGGLSDSLGHQPANHFGIGFLPHKSLPCILALVTVYRPYLSYR